MTALELISLVNQGLFIGLFVAVFWHALRRPGRAAVNTAMLFGAIAGVVGVSRVAAWLGFTGQPVIAGVTIVLLNLVPLAMIRLVDDFSGTPRWVQAGGFVAFAALAAVALTGAGVSAPVIVATIAFFLAVGGYAVVAFRLESRRAYGITRRRMSAVAIGAGLFIAAVVLLFAGALVDEPATWAAIAAQLLALAAVLAFFIGFAPPAWIRRAWREPELRRFLERSVHLTGVADEHTAVRELERAAAAAFGARGAAIGIAVDGRDVLRYAVGPDWVEYPDTRFIAGQAYRDQTLLVVHDAIDADPENASLYENAGAHAIIAAPVTSEQRRVGVITVFAERAPIFVEDDLWLLELLAAQTALLLETRTVTAEASELRAREEATRLKEEFLSAAAHDLRTPLTVVLGQAELMERRMARNPGAPADAVGIARVVREARRLRDLVAELLDAQRLEDGRAVLDRTPADVREVIETVRDRHVANGVELAVRSAAEPLVSAIDRPRIEQVLDNLVENAIKYGRATGGAPEIEAMAVDGHVRISVIDHGLGVPESDRDRVFERFYRAANAQDVTDTGLGLGLYICRRIVDEHGGRIWHSETPSGGSTFVFELPLEPAPAAPAETPELPESEAISPLAGPAVADA